MKKKHRWQIALAVFMVVGSAGVAQAAPHHEHTKKSHRVTAQGRFKAVHYRSARHTHGTTHANKVLPATRDDYTALTPTALQLMHLSPVEFAGVGAAPQPVTNYAYQFKSFPSKQKASVSSPEFVDQSLLLVKTGLPAAAIAVESPVKPVAVPVDAVTATATPEQPHLRVALEMLASQAYHWARHPLQTLESSGDAVSGPHSAAELADDIALQAGQFAATEASASTGSSWLSPRAMVVSALKFIGAPYRWGGMSPVSGFDCSGFVKYILAKFDIRVPRTSYAQAADLHRVSRENLKPGDLVFFDTMHRPFSHVGIYIGHQHFVSAQTPRTGVQVASLNDPYWAARYDGARSLPVAHTS